MLKSSDDTTRAHEQELESDSNGATAPSIKTPDGEVTTPSPSEAHTADPRQKASRSKEAKRSANKATAETAPFVPPKLPFEFADQGFSEAVFENIVAACMSGPDLVDNASLKSMTSVMMSQKPKDPFQLMLMHQMVGIHGLTMKNIGHLRQAENGAEVDLFERTVNKLARTFAIQVDVLHRCSRSNGEQRLTVQQNVSVNEGGQAIVANIAENAGADSKPKPAPAMITDAHTAPMQIIEPNEQDVPVVAKRRRSDDSKA